MSEVNNPMWKGHSHAQRLGMLSHDYLRILVSRAEDPMMGDVQGYAQRAICFAEALLVELKHIEAGQTMKDSGGVDIENHMAKGQLFAAFRVPGR